MKTYINKFTTVLGLILLSIALVACGKKNDDNNNNAPVNGQYQLINGYCYPVGQSTTVPTSYCTQNNGGVNNGYYMGPNGQCMGPNGQIALQQYCQNNGGINNGMGTARICYGQFYDMYNQIGTCNGANCRGYQLREVSTGQTVQCM